MRISSECLPRAARQHLQRYVPVEFGVSGAIHLSHAAFPDLGGDGIAAELSTWSEGHGLRHEHTLLGFFVPGCASSTRHPN